MLPTLRADFAATGGFVAGPDDRVGCPMLVVAGRTDPFCPPAAMVAWSAYATTSRHQIVDCGHFPLAENPDGVLACLAENLDLFPRRHLVPEADAPG
jgi:surfactin synthase thioesterase subunit